MMDTYIKDKGKCHSMVKWKPSVILLFMKGLNQMVQCAYHFPKMKSRANNNWLTEFLVMALDNKIKFKTEAAVNKCYFFLIQHSISTHIFFSVS